MTYQSIGNIANVALVGGTHGNELTGVYLIRKYKQYPQIIQRSTFSVHSFLANPQAIELGRRYVDTDLNRCFKRQDLLNLNLSNYEQILAKHIALKLQQQEPVDLIIDLHSTTANMGITIILNNSHPYLLRLAAYISSINPTVKILQYQSSQDLPYLRSLTELGLAIEVGNIAHGTLNPFLFQETELVIKQILDYIEVYNKGLLNTLKIPNSLTLYRQVCTLDYPRDDKGQIRAMLHPQILFKDYEPIGINTPLFFTFDGEEIGLNDKEKFLHERGSIKYCPFFINEAEYLNKKIAMSLAIQKQITLSN